MKIGMKIYARQEYLDEDIDENLDEHVDEDLAV